MRNYWLIYNSTFWNLEDGKIFFCYKAIAQNTPNQGPALGGVWPNAVLCKTYTVCCCVYLNNQEINHGSQNVLAVLTWIGGYQYFIPSQKLAENVAHNLCNSNNTAPSIGIIWVTIYAPMEKSVTFTGACANEIIPNG